MGSAAPVPFVDDATQSLGPTPASAETHSWANAATPPAAAPPAAATPAPAAATPAPNAPPTGATMGAGMGAAANQAGAGVTAPALPVVTSNKPGGLMGAMKTIMDGLVGKTTPEIGTDQYGNKYVKQTNLTGGQQWMRLGAEARVGAAKGLAAGRGAGNLGASAAAGVDAGMQMRQAAQQQQKDVTAEARAQNLENANAQQQRMNLMEQSLRMTRLQQEIDAPTLKASSDLASTYTAAGGEKVDHAESVKDIAAFLKETPERAAQLIQQQRIGIVPTYETDPATGKAVAKGFDVYLMKDGWRKDVAPAGSEFPYYNDATGQLETHRSSGPMSMGQLTDLKSQAIAASKKAAADAAQQKTLQEKQDADLKHVKAETAEQYSTAAKNQAEATKTKAETPDDSLVESIGTGKIAPDRLSYLLARNPNLVTAVTAKYPDFDSSKAQAYPALYKDFTSGKTAAALNSGATALGHLQELANMNTVQSHIPGRPDYNAYMNKVDTVAPELAKFYGDATIPAIRSI